MVGVRHFFFAIGFPMAVFEKWPAPSPMLYVAFYGDKRFPENIRHEIKEQL